MGSNTIYMGNAEGQFIRIPAHACQCDECKLLDPHDAETLRICRLYLEKELSFEKWQEEFIGHDIDCSHINKWTLQFGSGPIKLSDAVEMLLYSDVGHGSESFSEEQFQLKLYGLLYGYEVRQRTTHLWKLEEPAASSADAIAES